MYLKILWQCEHVPALANIFFCFCSHMFDFLCLQEATEHSSNMDLIRASLKMYNTNRHKSGAAMSCSLESHFTPADTGKFGSDHNAPMSNTVWPIPRSNFDDLCQIYPCREPSSPGRQPQQSDDEVDNTEQNHVNLVSKIDSLGTVDIVKILLQPTVLDTVVTELEKNFLAE